MSTLNWRINTSLPFIKPIKIILNPYNQYNIKKINNTNKDVSYIFPKRTSIT